MNERRVALIAGAGCVILFLLLLLAIPVGLLAANEITQIRSVSKAPPVVVTKVVEALPTLPPPQPTEPPRQVPQTQPPQQRPGVAPGSMTELYKQVNPGVVNIQVQVSQGIFSGEGAGSGFILDEEGHIVTNSHVVANADRVLVVFYNGIEAEAEVIGTDNDSDLAVVKVDELPEGAHSLAIGNSDQVEAGEWVIAIGNPFGQQSSMTVGIVSAVGRTIPSLSLFDIPQAIQTDAAINPGNSGGPLLNVNGEVVGVNAQIAAGGVRANAGVGFAIPSNIVQLVVPSLIEKGSYTWPWLGVSGVSVNLGIQRLNDLNTQQGAYIAEVIDGSPAAEVGLRGSRSQDQLVGGDVVIEADGKPITGFSDLLIEVAFRQPGYEMELTILRNGQRRQVTVTLAPRPENLNNNP